MINLDVVSRGKLAIHIAVLAADITTTSVCEMADTRIPTTQKLSREVLVKLLKKAGLDIPDNTAFYHGDGNAMRLVEELELSYTTNVPT